MNLLKTIRDFFDAVTYPLAAIFAKNKKIIRSFVAVAAIFSLFFLFFPHLQKKLGNVSFILLLATMFFGPIAKISQSKTFASIMPFRRDAGILMGIFAIEHSLLYFIKVKVPFSAMLTSDFWISNGNPTYTTWGSLALIITIILLISSNDFSVRLLKTNWKKLHRLIYLLLIFVALHIAFVKHAYFKVSFIMAAYAFVKILSVAGFQIPAKHQLKRK